MAVIARPSVCSALCTVEKESIQVACFHCGDPCVAEHRLHEGKDFCCRGCQVVYDLLNEAGLCNYYELGGQPGVKQQVNVDEHRPELFALEEVRSRLVEFSERGSPGSASMCRRCIAVRASGCWST
jgi:Putative metal-binding domain of cation transport ATPase.